jgi:hypothetical protein
LSKGNSLELSELDFFAIILLYKTLGVVDIEIIDNNNKRLNKKIFCTSKVILCSDKRF